MIFLLGAWINNYGVFMYAVTPIAVHSEDTIQQESAEYDSKIYIKNKHHLKSLSHFNGLSFIDEGLLVLKGV